MLNVYPKLAPLIFHREIILKKLQDRTVSTLHAEQSECDLSPSQASRSAAVKMEEGQRDETAVLQIFSAFAHSFSPGVMKSLSGTRIFLQSEKNLFSAYHEVFEF